MLGETQPDASSRISREIEHYLTLPVPIEFEDDPLAFWQHDENYPIRPYSAKSLKFTSA